MKKNKITGTNQSLTKIIKQDISGWLVLLPGVLLFAFFVWIPLISNIRLSVYSTKGLQLQEFVGFANYISVLKHPDFSAAFLNTFRYIFWSLVIGFLTPIIVAVLICETVRFKNVFRAAVYFPSMIPGLAVTLIGTFFFGGGKNGVLNILLGNLGLSPQTWLANAGWTIPLIVILCTWRAFGGTTLIYMASISGIDPALYEAATIDGAGVFRRITHIIVPSILSLGKTLLILQVISVFQILYEPLILTKGGPNNASISIMQLVYNYAFRDYNYAKAAALSVMMCIILLVLSGIYTKLTKTKE